MFMAVRHGKDGSWALVEERPPDCSSNAPPVVLPVGQLRELIPGASVAVESFELPGSRGIDVVGVDSRGESTLGLCRLAETAEIRQVCVARLLELAVRLRREIPFKEFEHRVQLLHRRPLAELIEESLSESERENFDSREFRLRLAQNLSAGRFRLVLAVDRMSSEFESFLSFIERSTEGSIEFYPVEVAVFEHGEWQAMIPRMKWPQGIEVVLPEVGPEGEVAEGPDTYDEDEVGSGFRMSVTGRHDAEARFFESLAGNSRPEDVGRVERLLALGREQSRLLPAGWIISDDALSFQVGFFREGDAPEPIVAEFMRISSDAVLAIDVPLLRRVLSDQAMDALARDLCTNLVLSTRLAQGIEPLEIDLAKAFQNDADVRLFCAAMRKLVLGLGLTDRGRDRDWAA